MGGHWPCVVSPTPLPRLGPCSQGVVCLQIREEIDHYGIRIYQFPECDSDEDEEFKLQDQALKVGLAPPAHHRGGRAPRPGGQVTLGYLQDSLGPRKLSSMEGLAHTSLPRQVTKIPRVPPAAWWGGAWVEKPRPRPLLSHGGSPQPGLWGIPASGCWTQPRRARGGMWVLAGGGAGRALLTPHALAGEHPLRCHRQQHGGGGQGPARPRAPLPLGHRGR